jgi:hypothetical protein
MIRVFRREKGEGRRYFLLPSPFSLLFFLFFTLSSAQSLTIETGLGYLEQGKQNYLNYLKIGSKLALPVADKIDLYIAPYWLGGFNIDAGVWFTLPLTIQDIEGFRSYVGTGLSLTRGRFGFALSAAISYDLADSTALTLSYTHRPLITPELSQAFDLALGIRFELGE